MGVESLLVLAVSLLSFDSGPEALAQDKQDPRDRLADAIREIRLKDVETAVAELERAEGPVAARALIASLGRARDRMAMLLNATVRARQAYDNVDTSFAFNLQEEKIKQKSLAAAKLRIQEVCKRSIDAEKIYDVIRAGFARLPATAIPVIAQEADRTGYWLHKCELLDALGALGAQKELASLMEREREPAVLATALSNVGSDQAAKYLAHSHWQVRLSAVKALEKSRSAVGPLVDALPGSDVRFRHSAVDLLTRMTGTTLPPDPPVWLNWWKANKGDVEAGNYNPSAPRVAEGPGTTTVFYEVPLVSSRVCFVIDRSRSMRELDRFDAARTELRRLIGSLPDDALVNIVFFGGTVSCFSSSTRVLDRDGRREAAAFIDRQYLEPATDLYAALEKSLTFVGTADTGRLREDGPDTIVVLSDGMATVGRVIDDELVARVIARRARYLRPVIHTISLSSDARSLQILSERAGGEYKVKQ